MLTDERIRELYTINGGSILKLARAIIAESATPAAPATASQIQQLGTHDSDATTAVGACDKVRDGWISTAIRNVAELSDRNSPDDQPEMMLVTGPELRACIERAIEECNEIAAPSREVQLQAVVDELVALKEMKDAVDAERDEVRACGGCMGVKFMRMANDYERRKPPAWQAARRLRSPNPQEGKK